MLIDTDVFIDYFRGYVSARDAILGCKERFMGMTSYLELMQAIKSNKEIKDIQASMIFLSVTLISLSEEQGFLAKTLMEKYKLKAGLAMGDALIAACAMDQRLQLLTGNTKHFKVISELSVQKYTRKV